MNKKLELWMELLFRIRMGKQVLVVTGSRSQPDLRFNRAKLKNFEIWDFSRTLILFPEGYKLLPAEEFEGIEGTMPKLVDEFSPQDLGFALREWVSAHKDVKFYFLHSDDPFWKEVCMFAEVTSTNNLTLGELGLVFTLDTGQEQDQKEEFPRRLRDFLDNLAPEDKQKVAAYVKENF